MDLSDRAARPATRTRITAIGLVFALALSYLSAHLFILQCFRYEHYKSQVYEQITTSSSLRAARGKIYDANMELLATEKTVYRVFVSPRAVYLRKKETGEDLVKPIAAGLSALLGVNLEALERRLSASSVLDATVKAAVEEEEYEKVLSFIKKNGYEDMVFTEAQSARFYPNGTLAAHVLGFVGSDAQGLYGLEYEYDSLLSGKNGQYLYAKDANGNILPTEYAAFLPPTDGCSIVTTLDSYLQEELEAQIEAVRKTHAVQNRVTGIVMDVGTGAILAMATSSPFDPNDPYTLDMLSRDQLEKSGYAPGSDQYKALKKELLEVMWSNKAVSETYEPGSTFKIVTVSTALDLGVAKPTDTFSCHGYLEVGGWRIKCHKTTGHGSGFSLAYGLQMSCNPTMMQIAERIGAENFYDYVEKFGYLEKTGIDLPSEARSIFHKKEAIGTTELATASFGQRFKVSVIGQLTAIAAVANGGKLVTPYLVEKVISPEGKIVLTHKTEVRRQVISEDVANEVAKILEEGVSGDGGAKNARVSGYKVAAKTGTSQKFDVLDANGNSYLRIGSTVAFAPSDTSGIAVILVVDEPTGPVKYGSTVAAPFVSAFLEKALPYLGYRSDALPAESEVPAVAGLSVKDAKALLKKEKIACEVVGTGETVLSQTPNAGSYALAEGAKVLLFTETGLSTDAIVPKLTGLTAAKANEEAIRAGFNLSFTGVRDGAGGATVLSQSLPPGTVAPRGTILTLEILYTDFED